MLRIGDFSKLSRISIRMLRHYDEIGLLRPETVANWVVENGYILDGKAFCIYHVNPSQVSNPEELVTEVCFSARKK